jgi:hypothetical protein
MDGAVFTIFWVLIWSQRVSIVRKQGYIWCNMHIWTGHRGGRDTAGCSYTYAAGNPYG